MHDHRRSNVSIEAASAVAAVLALGQRLDGDDPAFRARLGSSSRIDLYELASGALSLVCKHRGQLSPRGVVYLFRQHAPREALDVQVFDRNAAKSVDDLPAFLVQEVAAGVADVSLQLCNGKPALAAHLRAAFAASKSALKASELRSVSLRDVGANNRLARAESGERREPHVDPDAVMTSALNRRDLNVKNHVPLASVAAQNCGLRFTRKLPMPAYSDLARDANEAEFLALADRHAVTYAEVCGVIAVTSAKAREARFLTALDATEEGGIGLVELAHHLLLSGCGPTALVGKFFADLRQARDLLVCADRDAFLVSPDPVFEGGIVELTKIAKHFRQERSLRFVRLDAVAVAKDHGSTALLIFYVLTNRSLRNVANCAGEERPAPKRRKPGTQVRELLPKEARRCALEAVDDLRHGPGRISLDKHVNVIRHDLDFVNQKTMLSSHLVKKNFQARINGRNENGTPVLRAPHDMIFEAENSPGMTGVSRSSRVHALSYTRRTSTCQHLDERKGGASPVG